MPNDGPVEGEDGPGDGVGSIKEDIVRPDIYQSNVGVSPRPEECGKKDGHDNQLKNFILMFAVSRAPIATHFKK